VKSKHFFPLTFYVFLLLVIASAFVSGTALAQQPTPSDDEVNAIAKQLYCPVCENTPLDVCPTQACRQWRELIRQMLAEGKTEEEIKQYFVENYGARVLAEPPRSGVYFVLFYWLPVFAFAAGAFLLFRTLRAWNKTAKTEAGARALTAKSPPKDKYVEKLEEELRKRG